MKNSKKVFRFVLVLILLAFSSSLYSQKIKQKLVTITISGTSTLHDWEMNSSLASFSGIVNGNSISNVTFVMPFKSLKSRKGKKMENKAYETLKSSDIIFSSENMTIGKSNVIGKLLIAGVPKDISLPVNIIKKENSYDIETTTMLKLSDFGINRPGFLGMKAGDVIKVKVNIVAE